MDSALTDRRHERRLASSSLRIVSATMRPGCPVRVVDVSSAGVQVETERQLRPGSRVHLRLVTEGDTLQVAAQVLRCVVWALHAEVGVTYRGALRFEERCPPFAADGGPMRTSRNPVAPVEEAAVCGVVAEPAISGR
jgi:hypothetical protein